MGWFNDAWDWVSTNVGAYIKEASWLEFAKIAGGILIIFSVFAIIAFWYWLLHKAMNHGGDH